MTRELPIIVPPHDIPKLLDGTKTQVRRIVKLPKGLSWSDFDRVWLPNDGRPIQLVCFRGQRCPVVLVPRYRVGDVLWVCESWAVRGKHTDRISKIDIINNPAHFEFWTRSACVKDGQELFNLSFLGKWRPAETMPRNAARIFLRVEEVRVERAQDISEEDAQAEGVGPFLMGYAGVSADNMTEIESYRASFEDLWNTIHGEGAWSRNDWVWVYRFSRIENYRAAA